MKRNRPWLTTEYVANLRRRVATKLQPKPKTIVPEVSRARREVNLQRSPISGHLLPSWYSGSSRSESTPEVKPFKQEEQFELYGLGVCTRSVNGGVLPLWCREPGYGGSVDLTSEGQMIRRIRREGSPSYSYPKTCFDRPWPLPLRPFDEPEAIAPRGYKDEGLDVLGEALNGRFGFAEIQGATDQPTAAPMTDLEEELFYASPEAKRRFAALRR